MCRLWQTRKLRLWKKPGEEMEFTKVKRKEEKIEFDVIKSQNKQKE